MPIVSNKGQGKKGSQERKLRKLLEQKKRLNEELQLEHLFLCPKLVRGMYYYFNFAFKDTFPSRIVFGLQWALICSLICKDQESLAVILL